MDRASKRLEGATSGSKEQLLAPTSATNTSNSNYYRNLEFGQLNGGDRGGGGGGGGDEEEEEEEERRSNGNNQNNRTTEAQTMMHILKANIGTGVLAMPLAFKNVGLWLGLMLIPVIGAICIHCMNILIASHNRLCDRFNFESLDYDQVAALGLACGPKWARRFAKRAHIVVTVFLMFTQIGFCCVYTLFTVENLQVAMVNLFSLDYSTSTYLLAVFPLIGLTSCTSNLKHLARISTLANCLQLFGLSLIFFDLLQFHTYSEGALSARQEGAIVVEQGLGADILSGLPLFFATAVYAFEGIGVVLPLIKEMQVPERISGLNGVLDTSMSLVAVLYMAVGFFGYAKYGHTVAGSITLNLPETTVNELVRLAFALAIGLSYSLQFYVPWTIVWPLIDESLFYSYRPRVPRDKLVILDKLNKENHWAISGQAIEEHQREQALKRQQQRQGAQLLQQQRHEQQPLVECGKEDGARHHQHCDEEANGEMGSGATITIHTSEAAEQQQLLLHFHDANSTASTLATSYSMSTSCRWQQQPQQHLLSVRAAGSSARRPSAGQLTSASFIVAAAAATNQYGAINTEGAPPACLAASGLAALKRRKLRDRLEDVMERQHSEDEEDSMPDVQWRPPPRSMRGKRKLVRYTVILLTVSFTFIAAALIPRLDLFISLIGALASSCLAIIFPAIIQLCTFWNYNEEDEDDEELARAEDQVTLEKERERRKEERRERSSANSRARRPSRAFWTRRRRFKWFLFVAKNCFLVFFGVIGLITGSWVSLAQLGVAGVQV